jgi:hypothetical protein
MQRRIGPSLLGRAGVKVVEQVRANNVPYPTQCLDLRAQLRGRRDRGVQQQAAVAKPDDAHAGSHVQAVEGLLGLGAPQAIGNFFESAHRDWCFNGRPLRE